MYKPHELATLFPRSDAADTERMTKDIRLYGCRVPIVLYEGKILDGLTRYDICMRHRKQPFFRTFKGSHEDAIAHVTSLNLCRRHLTQAQKSAVGLSLQKVLEQSGVSRQEARAEAACEAKVSQDSIRRMEHIQEADEEVAGEVLNGRVSLKEAERRINPPSDSALAREAIQSAIASLKRANRYDIPEFVEFRIDEAIHSLLQIDFASLPV